MRRHATSTNSLRAAVLHADCSEELDRLSKRLRSLQAVQTPALIAGGAVLATNFAVSAMTPAWLTDVLWLWSGLLFLAALWHRLPPALMAPDVYWRIARSIDPLEPASEADEQVLRATRFAMMISATYVLVANDLIRETRLRFYDAVASESTDPRVQSAIDDARASADQYWVNIALLVLGVAIALGVGRRLHAVDGVPYAQCAALRGRPQSGEGWYVCLTMCTVAAVAGVLLLFSSLLA